MEAALLDGSAMDKVRRTLFDQAAKQKTGPDPTFSDESAASKTLPRRPLGGSATSTATKETTASAASQARLLASEAKSIEVAVLRLYDSNTTSDGTAVLLSSLAPQYKRSLIPPPAFFSFSLPASQRSTRPSSATTTRAAPSRTRS